MSATNGICRSSAKACGAARERCPLLVGRRGGSGSGPSRAMQFAVEIEIGFELAEIGQHVLPAPPARAEPLPLVVVVRRAAQRDHAHHGRAAADDARLVESGRGRVVPRCANAPSAPATCRPCCSRRRDRHRGCRPALAPAACRRRPREAEPNRPERADRRFAITQPAEPPPTTMRVEHTGDLSTCVAAVAWLSVPRSRGSARQAHSRDEQAKGAASNGGTMQRSEHRILTTHAGSLPRPAALTTLFAQARARRSRRSGARSRRRAAPPLRAIVKKQIETGLDVIDDGEQSRESFVLYHAPSPDRARRQRLAADARRSRRLSALQGRVPAARDRRRNASPTARILPKAIGAVSLCRSHRDRGRMRRFPRRARRGRAAVTSRRSSPRRRPASSPRSCRTSTTTASSAISMRSAPRCRSNTRRSCATAFCCSSIAPISRSSATPPTATARSPTSSASSRLVVAAINKALRNIPRDEVRLHVCWGNYEGPHDRDVALRDILPAILQGQCRRDLPAVRQSAPRARVPRARGHAARRRPAASSPA